ncbi:MAG: TetR/AcrR family transcriptional regulator [Anaerolineaceae bacterium]|nr:TetR/AcrR family transcriptional regulator [Anaerolineaceae bacterium]
MNPELENNGSRMDRKKEDTKRKIIHAAMLLFKDHGLEQTTMEQIAEQADIAKGTLYNYYPVKEAIISDYIERVSTERNSGRIERLPELLDTRTRLIRTLRELISWVKDQPVLFEKYFTYQIQHIISLRPNESTASGFRLIGTEIILLGEASGEIRTDLPFDSLISLFEFVFIKVVQKYYQDPQSFNDDEVIRQYVDLFMNAVKI